MDLKDFRRQYTLGGLKRSSMPDDPFTLFERWQADANEAGLADPTGVVLATQQPDGQMRQRFVLLKGCDDRGFIFFTNYNSNKAAAMDSNRQVSLLFPWNELDRQVSISGTAEKLPAAESDAYFASRPRASQLSAWASNQSQSIASRASLEAQLDEVSARFEGGSVPRPEGWGGYVVNPQRIEFWQGGSDRLHDRFAYTNDDSWTLERLQP